MHPSIVDQICDYEMGFLDDHGILELFGQLVKTGQAWTLQGHYGRQAEAMIRYGYLDREGNILKEVEA